MFLKIFVDFLTSTLFAAQNTTLLSQVWRRLFSNFVAFSKNPKFTCQIIVLQILLIFLEKTTYLLLLTTYTFTRTYMNIRQVGVLQSSYCILWTYISHNEHMAKKWNIWHSKSFCWRLWRPWMLLFEPNPRIISQMFIANGHTDTFMIP